MVGIANNPMLSARAYGQPTILPQQILEPDTLQALNNVEPSRLANIASTYQGLDQYSGQYMTDHASQFPFNSMQPSQAYQMYAPTMGPSYYPGGQTQSMPQMQSNYRMGQQYMQQAMAGQQGMGNYGNPGAFGGLNGYGGMGGGGMPGMGGGGNVPGAGNLTAEEAKSAQDEQIKDQMNNYNEALQLFSSIENAEHSVRSSIIQNIR